MLFTEPENSPLVSILSQKNQSTRGLPGGLSPSTFQTLFILLACTWSNHLCVFQWHFHLHFRCFIDLWHLTFPTSTFLLLHCSILSLSPPLPAIYLNLSLWLSKSRTSIIRLALHILVYNIKLCICPSIFPQRVLLFPKLIKLYFIMYIYKGKAILVTDRGGP
jgi:hypothetical protein